MCTPSNQVLLKIIINLLLIWEYSGMTSATVFIAILFQGWAFIKKQKKKEKKQQQQQNIKICTAKAENISVNGSHDYMVGHSSKTGNSPNSKRQPSHY